MILELKGVDSEGDWIAYHSIREAVLWNARGRLGTYDRHHPDEHEPGHHPMLLVRDGEAVGVIRIDLEPPWAWFRRVAVREDVQRQGYGRCLLELAQEFAASRGCTCLRSSVDPKAVGFYRRLGFRECTPDRAGTSVPMEKQL